MRNYASPMFQHRHYAAIAKVLSEVKPDASNSPEFDMWLNVVAELENTFTRDNSGFSRDRFEAASYGEPVNGKDKR